MKMEKKWYNVELTPEDWEDFKFILTEDEEKTGKRWEYEASDCGNKVHIEIKCTLQELDYVNELLDELW